MKVHLRLVSAYVFILPIFHSLACCSSESLTDPSSNTIHDELNEQENGGTKLDSSIERIFRGSNDRDTSSHSNNVKNGSLYKDKEYDATKVHASVIGNPVRVKRDTLQRETNHINGANGSTCRNGRRSISDQNSAKVNTKDERESREVPKITGKETVNYDSQIVGETKDKSDYGDEDESEFAAASRDTDVEFRGGDARVVEDSDRFIDQEERSSLYDDFEAKDVVKRGISGAEDYEEIDEKEEPEIMEDTAAVQERESIDEEIERGKVRSDVRRKRDRSEKALENEMENEGKGENSLKESKEPGPFKRDEKTENREDAQIIADKSLTKAEKDFIDQDEQSKRNIAEKEDSKMNSDLNIEPSRQSLTENEKSAVDAGEVKSVKENQETDEAKLSNEQKIFNELVSPVGVSKTEDLRIVVSNPNENSKIDRSISKDSSASSDISQAEESGNANVPKELEGDYQRRVEDEIQRRIDAIKEDIKREIEQKRRIREIEENNAKFDELHAEEKEDEDRNLEGEEHRSKTRRSIQSSGRSSRIRNGEKRSTGRKKREEESNSKNNRLDRRVVRKVTSSRDGAGKRSIETTSGRLISKKSPVKRRDHIRQVFLVRNDQSGGRKRRRSRSQNSGLIPEQGKVKMEDNLSAGRSSDSSLHGVNDGKSSSSMHVVDDEKSETEQDSSLGRKSDSVASLTGNSEELDPRLATEYGEAFGGLQGEPGVALGRFKRIKRVLRPPGSKT